MTQKITPDLAKDKIFNLLIVFGLPAMIGLMINASYNFVDRIFVGNGVGSIGLAALAVCFPCFVLQLATGMLIGVGGSVNFAISLGQKKIAKAEHIMTNSFALILIFGIPFIALHYAFLDDFLKLYGAPTEVIPYAKTYLTITLAGTIFFIASVTLNNFIRACGHPQFAMLTLFVGAVTNTILDYVFIFKFNWGIAGAAYATTIAQVLSFLWTFAFFFSKRSPYRPRAKFLPLNLKIVGMICVVGMAPFLIQVCNGFVQTVFNKTLVQYGGSLAVSAFGLSMATVMILFMPAIGICEGAQPVIGFNLGAKLYKRVLKIYRQLIYITTGIFGLAWILLQLYSSSIVKVFDPNDAELIRVGTQALKAVGITIPFVGLQLATVYFLQATKCPKMATFLSMGRQIIFLIPFILILPKYMGVEGVFYSLPGSDVIAFMISLPIYFHQRNRYKQLADEYDQSAD